MADFIHKGGLTRKPFYEVSSQPNNSLHATMGIQVFLIELTFRLVAIGSPILLER